MCSFPLMKMGAHHTLIVPYDFCLSVERFPCRFLDTFFVSLLTHPLLPFHIPGGVPNCADAALLNGRIREEWGRDDALVVSDCGALGNMVH